MVKFKCIVKQDIHPKATVSAIDHAKLQKAGGAHRHGVRFGKHTPDWKLTKGALLWGKAKKKGDPAPVTGAELQVRYTGAIVISKAIDRSSKCYKLVKEHEEEHQKICVKETKTAVKACEAILEKHLTAVLKTYKEDWAVISAKEKEVLTKVAVGAFKEMDDGPYLKVAYKSLSIDTPSNYAKISPHCADFG